MRPTAQARIRQRDRQPDPRAMKPISFAWTTPALLAGRKSCTRRDWSDKWAMQFRAGEKVAAYDRQPRHGGRQVAVIELTGRPYRQSTTEAPESDWEAEGFDYLQEIGARVDGMSPRMLWRAWHLYPQVLWVVRFRLVEPARPDPQMRLGLPHA